MDIYAEIRRLHREGYSERKISKELHISRKTVHKYIKGSILPGERKTAERTPVVMTDEVRDFISDCLNEDELEKTTKQNHTARRIYDRLVLEKGFTGGESTVRSFVRECKAKAKEAFVPLTFPMGDAVQVDWGEINPTLTMNLLR